MVDVGVNEFVASDLLAADDKVDVMNSDDVLEISIEWVAVKYEKLLDVDGVVGGVTDSVAPDKVNVNFHKVVAVGVWE